MRSVAEVVRLAIDNNMSARAPLVEIDFQHEQTYDIAVGTTLTEDRVCAPQLGMQDRQISGSGFS
jgi:hypothetical protein